LLAAAVVAVVGAIAGGSWWTIVGVAIGAGTDVGGEATEWTGNLGAGQVASAAAALNTSAARCQSIRIGAWSCSRCALAGARGFRRFRGAGLPTRAGGAAGRADLAACRAALRSFRRRCLRGVRLRRAIASDKSRPNARAMQRARF